MKKRLAVAGAAVILVVAAIVAIGSALRAHDQREVRGASKTPIGQALALYRYQPEYRDDNSNSGSVIVVRRRGCNNDQCPGHLSYGDFVWTNGSNQVIKVQSPVALSPQTRCEVPQELRDFTRLTAQQQAEVLSAPTNIETPWVGLIPGKDFTVTYQGKLWKCEQVGR